MNILKLNQLTLIGVFVYLVSNCNVWVSQWFSAHFSLVWLNVMQFHLFTIHVVIKTRFFVWVRVVWTFLLFQTEVSVFIPIEFLIEDWFN